MKKTALYEWHKNNGARFQEFGGYSMPLWYQSAKEEHFTVLNNAGIFDTSHMALFSLKGKDSFKLLQRTFTRDVSKLKYGRCSYGLFLKDDGTVLDDAIVYCVDDLNYMVVVNSGMSGEVISHIKRYDTGNCKIDDYKDLLCKIDIQGPGSLRLMEMIFKPEYFDDFPYFSFKGTFDKSEIHFNDRPVMISRSGYTGEFGFELYVEKENGEELWSAMVSKGAELGIRVCGLASRDSLRVGAGLPLSHQDIGSWIFNNTPWDFTVSDNKDCFVGQNRISEGDSYTYSFAGFDMRKLHAGTEGKVLYKGENAGVVLTCVTEVSLTRVDGKIISSKTENLPSGKKVKGLSAGFIKINKELSYGDIVTISDGKREFEVEIVKNIRSHRTARMKIDEIRRGYV